MGNAMAHNDRPATLRDVATAAGVHPATASRALNPGTRLLVSEETARRVSEAAERLGYRPNPVARSLRTRRSHTIGVLIPDLNNPLFPPIVRGIEDRLAEHGYVALIGNTDADLAKERLVFDQMRARHVDGFVLATAIAGSPILAEAAEDDVPVVLVNRTAQDYPFSSVSVDNEQGVRAAVAHLASLGHTRIGHIAGPQNVSTGAARLRGFQAGMAAHKLPVTDGQVVYASAYSLEEGARCGRELLERRTAASPRSSRATTCSRSAATAPSTSSACAARRTSPSSGSTTCRSSTGSARRCPRCGSRTTSSAPRRPRCCSSGSRPRTAR